VPGRGRPNQTDRLLREHGPQMPELLRLLSDDRITLDRIGGGPCISWASA
jgi:hypothetical protein